MAASNNSDDSSSAPRIFDISSSLEENSGKASVSVASCPVCTGSKRGFYCRNCIQDGLFIRSTALHFPESFASKKQRLSAVLQNKELISNQINIALADRMKAENLRREIAGCQERIRLLRLLLEESQIFIEQARRETERRAAEIDSRKRAAIVYDEKMKSMQEEKERFQAQIRLRRQEYGCCCLELQRVIRENVDHLVKYIFPIERIKSDDNSGDNVNEDTVSAIAEASRTAYIRGRWVYSENSQDGKYKIVEALLPSSGDYSAYNEWVAASRDSVPGSTTELIHRNAGSAVSAGLTCATQLVSVLAFYLDVWMPKKLCYSEFCGRELSEREFSRKVAKLNANVIHLCLSQDVNPDVLRPRHTISNLLLLLTDEEAAPSGEVRRRIGSRWHAAFEVNADLMRCMEESLLQDLTDAGAQDDQDADSDGNDPDAQDGRDDLGDLFADWETIAPQLEQLNLNLPGRVTMSALPSPGSQLGCDAARAINYGGTHQQHHHQHLQHLHQPSDAATASMTDGLVSAAASVASWWRAAIGHK